MSEEHEDTKVEPAADALARAEEKPADLVVASKEAYVASLRSLALHRPPATKPIDQQVLAFAEAIEDVLADGCPAARRFVEVNVNVSRGDSRKQWTVVVQMSGREIMAPTMTSLRLCCVRSDGDDFPVEVVSLDEPTASQVVDDATGLQAALEHLSRTSAVFRQRLEDTLQLVSDLSM